MADEENENVLFCNSAAKLHHVQVNQSFYMSLTGSKEDKQFDLDAEIFSPFDLE